MKSGKTTTVTLVCKEMGFDAVEFNASDTRSKKLLQEEVAKMLTNTSITSLFGASGIKYAYKFDKDIHHEVN